MKKSLIKTTFYATAIAFTLLSFTSCSDDDENSTMMDDKPMTIGAFVETNQNYSSLNAALIATDLKSVTTDNNQNITVFAPDNTAFSAFLSAKGFANGLADVDTPEEIALVKNILLNHVILDNEVKASSVVSTAPAYIKNAAMGPKDVANQDTHISLFYDVVEGDVLLNGKVTVTTPDAYDATNGIIHAVDQVIDLPMISTFVVADARVSILKEKLIETQLVAPVDNQNPATVFAPLNAAFSALESVPSGSTLENILKYHVISGANAVASDLPNLRSNTPETLQGQTIAITSTNSIQGNDNTDAANFVINDIQAANGVIHVIDKVLLPNMDK
ncbi:fasciclin domain-containing protein [Ochrovirga pacifica]|uniref:fasciclin domain-containing protein n=1 Tax=Ochrovirga pacifica TaxID=1042376 RepID=UPI0002557F89|nr:fasciclin domain-containing protein [Ochrovirga pacifica]